MNFKMKKMIMCLVLATVFLGLCGLTVRVKADTGDLKAPDGALIIDTMAHDVHLFAAASDGRDIYYSINWGYFRNSKSNLVKRNIKTGKEVAVKKYEEYSHTGYDSIKLFKDYFIAVRTHGSRSVWHSIYKVLNNGTIKELAIGRCPVISGNSIYYIAEKIQNIGISDTLGIYKMDLNGGNITLVKKFENKSDEEYRYDSLGISGGNLYYSKFKYIENIGSKTKWFNLKTGKQEKNIIFSHLYNADLKRKLVFNKKVIKVGKYKKGKWEYKTILKHNKVVDEYHGIAQVRVCGDRILVQIDEQSRSKIYMLDLDGKNRKLIKEFDLVS